MHVFSFLENRVLRLYHGGAGIDRLCGKTNAEDGRFPENWIASCIEGNGRSYHSPGHGISKISMNGEVIPFPDFLKAHATELLGEEHISRYGCEPGVLVKLLDSAEQLPIQVHPSKENAKKYLNSKYGKLEAWIILSTREINGEKPYLLIGFNEKFNRETFIRETLDGKYEKSKEMFNKLKVVPGDVIIIRGGLLHAIGPGVTMVEIMEPSDWVMIPEIDCCGIRLNEKQRFMGVDPEIAMNMFDFTTMTEAGIRAGFSPGPTILSSSENGTLKSLISPEECELFSVRELSVNGFWNLENPDSFGIGVVTEGKLNIDGENISQGESFFLPFCLKQCKITGTGKLLLIRPAKGNHV